MALFDQNEAEIELEIYFHSNLKSDSLKLRVKLHEAECLEQTVIYRKDLFNLSGIKDKCVTLGESRHPMLLQR